MINNEELKKSFEEAISLIQKSKVSLTKIVNINFDSVIEELKSILYDDKNQYNIDFYHDVRDTIVENILNLNDNTINIISKSWMYDFENDNKILLMYFNERNVNHCNFLKVSKNNNIIYIFDNKATEKKFKI